MSNTTPNVVSVDIPRSENPGIRNLQAVVQELRGRLPVNLEERTPIVLGAAPNIYIIVGDSYS
jgi:hypothetical protein